MISTCKAVPGLTRKEYVRGLGSKHRDALSLQCFLFLAKPCSSRKKQFILLNVLPDISASDFAYLIENETHNQIAT
jgi:hypothetical protein